MGYRKMDAVRMLMEKFYSGKENEYPVLIPSNHNTFE
jgi:hypothetical protein